MTIRGLVLRNSDKFKEKWYRERGQERPLNTSPNEKGARRSLDTVLVTLSGHSGPSLPSKLTIGGEDLPFLA